MGRGADAKYPRMTLHRNHLNRTGRSRAVGTS
jgi:hypothetical protein